MNARKSNDPRWIGVLHRVYSGALWLYPPSHRKRWGDAMRQAFRDRCREAVREGRGPLNVLFAELLPDLARTVGSEHVDAIYLEANPMKRLLYVLIFTFVAVVMLHPQITPALDAVHDWQLHRQAVAYKRAYSAHLDVLAQATEQQQHHEAHDDVIAAILYSNAANVDEYSSRFSPISSLPTKDAINGAARDALRDKADAAFARALQSGDRWALWTAIERCPARTAVCAQDASLARLRQSDADNGAVWLAEMEAAQRKRDPVRARSALARLAQATRFDSHTGDFMRALLLAFDRKPVPAQLAIGSGWYHLTPSSSAIILARELADGYYEYPALKLLPDSCRARDTQADAQLAADCHAAGKLMSEDGSLLQKMVGYRVWLRSATDGERDQVRQSIRDGSWRWQATAQLDPEESDKAASAWKAAWLAGGNELDVYQHLMQHQGIALNAPASFQLRPEQYDPPSN